MYNEFDEQAIRERVEKRLDARRDFNIHAIIYVCVNGFLWLLWATLPSIIANVEITEAQLAEFQQVNAFLPWPVFVMIPWGIGLLAHFLTYYYKFGGGAQRREEVISREIQREMAQRGLVKRKRNDRLTLTTDGELSGDSYTDSDYAEDIYDPDYDAQSR